jgi:hypothetical protein
MTELVKRQLFKTEKVEILSLEELKMTVSAKDVGKTSRTRPVTHYQFIEDIMRILTEANQAPILAHIYCAKSGGTKIIPKIEEQLGVKDVIDAWLLDKITGRIMIPSLTTEDTECCVAFSYHDKGLDLAFGSNVRDCSNVSIFGSNVMHTYGAKKDASYERMLEVFKEWSGKLDKMYEEDLKLIKSMMMIKVTGKEMLRFLGKLMVSAIKFNMGFKVVAPLNVTQVNEVIRGIITKKGEKFYEGPDCTLWEFYNFMTFVMKGDKADITTLLTDVAAIGNMMIAEYDIQPTINVVSLDTN